MRPGIVTVGLFAFALRLERLLRPSIPINPTSEQPLPLALVNLRQQTMGAVDFGSTEAEVVVMAIPVPGAVPGPAALLRPGLHVGSHQRINTLWSGG